MKKILFVYDSMMTGGTTTALLSLLNAIDYNKYEISLRLYQNEGNYLSDLPKEVHLIAPAYLKTDGVFWNSGRRKIVRTLFNGQAMKAIGAYFKYRGTPKGNFRNILMHYGMKAQVSLSKCDEEEYDVAIGFMEGWSHFYVMSEKVRAKKKILWLHPEYGQCFLIPEEDRNNFRKADRIVLVAQQCKTSFLQFFSEFSDKTNVIENIVSPEHIIGRSLTERAENLGQAAINICTVCRCDITVKGLDRIIQALSALKREGVLGSAVWHLIGSGKDMDALCGMIEAYGIQENTRLHGDKKNPLPYLHAMDVFLLASRYEGKPVSVTEALVLGIPCVVTNYVSAKEQIVHEVNGLIVSNDYSGVYGGLKRLLTEPELIVRLKENVKKHCYGNEEEINRFYELVN